jgi:hypothetical protein
MMTMKKWNTNLFLEVQAVEEKQKTRSLKKKR